MMQYNEADIKLRMMGAVKTLHDNLSGLRTECANVALLNPVVVEMYGSQMSLNQVATVSVADPSLLTVQVWDGSNVAYVVKAIGKAALGLHPIVEGQMIRLPIPILTGDRRLEMAKLAEQYAEKSKIAIRNVRRDGNEALKNDQKAKLISEDELRRLEAKVQKITNDVIKIIDDAIAIKKKEILQ
jgi:ribosome recycling factor